MKLVFSFLWTFAALRTAVSGAFVPTTSSAVSPSSIRQQHVLPMAMAPRPEDGSIKLVLKMRQQIATAVAGLAFVAWTLSPIPASADGQTKEFKFPPIDFSDKNRCVLSSSSMGQANAARDKLYDLRQCKLSGVKAAGYDLSGVIMTDTDFSNADVKEAYFSKGYLRDSNFEGADFSNAIVDRATFKGSSLKGAIFKNTVLTGTSFEGANVENADFTEAAIGEFDLRSLCKNPTMKGENPVTGVDTRFSAGCK